MGRSSSRPPEGTIFLVTGSTLRAEEMDRPLAYFIRQRISQIDDRPVYVISDYRYLYENSFKRYPTISIGGPGINALGQKWLEDLPVAMADEGAFYLQLSEDGSEPLRASIWGMDHEATRVAVATFLENYLERFLDVCANRV